MTIENIYPGIFGIIGILGFLGVGLLVFLTGFWKPQGRNDRRVPWYQRGQILAGIGIMLFGCFIGFFVLSQLSTTITMKIGAFAIGFLLFIVGLICIGLSFIFYRKNIR